MSTPFDPDLIGVESGSTPSLRSGLLLAFLLIFLYHNEADIPFSFFFMKNYKIVMVLRSDLKKEKKEKIFTDIRSWIGNMGKETIKALGDKKLAYPIKRQPTGEYLIMEFAAENVTPMVEKRMQMTDDVLRHMILRV